MSRKNRFVISFTLFWVGCSLIASLLLPAFAAPEGAPVAENLTLSTYRDVSVSGQLSAVDPEGSLLTYQITSQPARGKVTLSDPTSGDFLYTPYDRKTGSDSFTYVAVNSDGVTSSAATVKITISRTKTEVTYADLEGSGVGACAQRLAEEGVFVGAQVGDLWYFRPQEEMDRATFLAMAMTALGCDRLENVTSTGFADDGAMETWSRSYAASALQQGYLTGVETSDGLAFLGNEPITTAQAAVLVNRMLELTDASQETFGGGETAPTWATQAVVNLTSCGIPCPEPEEVLSRAEAAEMICGAMDVLRNRDGKGWLWF